MLILRAESEVNYTNGGIDGAQLTTVGLVPTCRVLTLLYIAVRSGATPVDSRFLPYFITLVDLGGGPKGPWHPSGPEKYMLRMAIFHA